MTHSYWKFMSYCKTANEGDVHRDNAFWIIAKHFYFLWLFIFMMKIISLNCSLFAKTIIIIFCAKNTRKTSLLQKNILWRGLQMKCVRFLWEDLWKPYGASWRKSWKNHVGMKKHLFKSLPTRKFHFSYRIKLGLVWVTYRRIHKQDCCWMRGKGLLTFWLFALKFSISKFEEKMGWNLFNFTGRS